MPLLRGKLSKSEQITVSQEMFQSSKANKKNLIDAWAICCVSQGLTVFHRYPNLACSQSCNLLWQHRDQALQKLPELYLGKEEEADLGQRTVVASQNWFFSHCCHFLMSVILWCSVSLWPETTLCLEDVKFCWVVWSAKFCWVLWSTKLKPQLGFRTIHRRDTFLHRIFCVVKEKCSLDWLFFFLVFISVCLH